MKKTIVAKILTVSLLGILAACSHNPNKAEKLDTKIDNSDKVTDERIGVKDGNMVVQRKTLMSEELRRLQYEVYEKEDRVYGNNKYGSKGLYGVLKDCKKDISSKKYGGTGKLIWTEPIDRVTDKEEELKIGLDENKKIIGLSEEFLKDRINRFKEYKRILLKREDEYEDKVEICNAELRSRQYELDAKKAADNNSKTPVPSTTPTETVPN